MIVIIMKVYVRILQEGVSMLQRLLDLLKHWTLEIRNGDDSPEQSLPDVWNIKTVAIEEMFREESEIPASRIWMVPTGDAWHSLDMIIKRFEAKVNVYI